MPSELCPDGPNPSIDRMTALDAYDIPGLRDDPRLIAITDFASALCDTPIALISFVEEHRQWFPARTGLNARETPRDSSFCAHAMSLDDIMEVPDAVADTRFCDNPLVNGDPNIRFYAGAPLKGEDGVPLGALCVIDRAPRQGLTALQRQGLKVLAQNIVSLLTMRRSNAQTRRELGASESQFRTLADTMPQMVWSTLPDGYHDYYNARWYEFTGAEPGTTDGEKWNGMFHPEDQDRAWSRWRHSLQTGEPYEIEYRLRDAQGNYRWTLGRALPIRDESGAIARWFGTCTDIHDTKLLIEQRDLIMQELNHRIKNILSVIDGLVSYSARFHPEMKGGANDLRGRIHALGRAHDLARPAEHACALADQRSGLHELIGKLLAPYDGEPTRRIAIEGDDLAIDGKFSTPLSLLFHELATNAAKYGALKCATGKISVNSRLAGKTLNLCWKETGGPAVSAPGPDGFGSKLVELSVVRQLRGTIAKHWHSSGLVVEIALPLDC